MSDIMMPGGGRIKTCDGYPKGRDAHVVAYVPMRKEPARIGAQSKKEQVARHEWEGRPYLVLAEGAM
jgi:hypothetical protein